MSTLFTLSVLLTFGLATIAISESRPGQWAGCGIALISMVGTVVTLLHLEGVLG